MPCRLFDLDSRHDNMEREPNEVLPHPLRVLFADPSPDRITKTFQWGGPECIALASDGSSAFHAAHRPPVVVTLPLASPLAALAPSAPEVGVVSPDDEAALHPRTSAV